MISALNTPVLLIIFNRPETTQEVFNRIKAIKPSFLFVAADGPRPENQNDLILCRQTREIINQIDWECNVKTLFRKENLGCGLAVYDAIRWFFSHVEEGIILEDDCLPDLSFFPFCEELLRKYREDNRIFLVSGTNLQNGEKRGDESYFFSNYPITWGWATWRRAWNHFEYNLSEPAKAFDAGELDHAFQSGQEKQYWKKKIIQSVTEYKNIWDYQWFFTFWKNRGMAITPNTNLIVNLGFRNQSSHNFLHDSIREPQLQASIEFPLKHPKIKINTIADSFTYNHAFSHSYTRIIRLLRENGFISILKYTFQHLVKL